MTKIGVKTGLLVALLGACSAGCDGGGTSKADARVDAKVDAGDAKVDTTPAMDTAADTTPAIDMNPGLDVNPGIDMVVAPDMVVATDTAPDTNPDAAVDMVVTPDMAADMTSPPDAAVDMPVVPDGSGTDTTVTTYTVGGTISGLLGTGAVLRNNGGDSLPLTPGATSFPFVFPTRLAAGATFAVTVQTQPSAPTQSCVVANGSGTVGTANVTNVAINCTTQSFTVGGTITGYTGSGLVLQNNAAGNLTIAANGTTFSFPAQASGTAYAVTVLTQPGTPTQVCTVANPSGTVAAANVTNVAVTCATQAFTVGGTIAGLTGTGLVLRNNGANDLTVAANATGFTFTTALATGSAYAVTVQTQPAGQTCTVNTGTGTGTVASANVGSVGVTCVSTYTVGGTIAGLTGTGLVLQNNAGDSLTVPAAATTFTFATRLANAAAYAVTVQTQPAGQTCTVATGSGNVAAANVTNVAVTCATRYSVGGTISGLTAGSLVLRNNGGDELTVASGSTSFTFATLLAAGAAYNVTIQTQPSAAVQCAITSGAMGNIAAANIGNVVIACTPRYSVGGTITGQTVAGLVLRNNGGNDITLPANSTTFTFPAPLLATGAAYAVTVQTNPTGLTCTPTMASGNVGTTNVSNVVITCGPASAAVTACAVGPGGAGVDITPDQDGVITCPTGKTITAVTFASWGKPTGACGSYVADPTCDAATSLSKVQSICTVGLATCTVNASNAAPPTGFGDPCGGEPKNLRISVTCQ